MPVSIRCTVYFESDLHQAPRLKAAHSHCWLSDLVNDAVRQFLCEDQDDLASFEQRVAESTMSCEALLNNLKANGTLPLASGI